MGLYSLQPDVILAVINDPIAQESVHAPIHARLPSTALDGAPRVIPIGYLRQLVEELIRQSAE